MSDYSSIFVPSSCVSKTQLLAYVQQKLDREEAYLVESHLNDCQFCSDALDGLLQADSQVAETDLKLAKDELSKKLFPVIVTETTPVEKNNNVRDFEISKKTFTRWLAAASILLIIGLGGYSVFSYIKSAKRELALKEGKSDGKSFDAKYSKPEGVHDEIVRIEVGENDTFRRYADEKGMNQTKKISEAIVSTENKTKKASVEEMAPPQAATKAVGTADEVSQSEEKVATAAPAPMKPQVLESPEIEANQNLDNNVKAYESEKAPAALSKEIAKKKSAGGLKNDNNFAQRNQLNNQYANNNNDNLERNRQQEVGNGREQALDEVKADSSPFERGMASFNEKKYKKSISYFEKALKSAVGAEKEDIMYHLALAYEYTGKNEKANELYAALSRGKKYSMEADKKLREVQSKDALKKK